MQFKKQISVVEQVKSTCSEMVSFASKFPAKKTTILAVTLASVMGTANAMHFPDVLKQTDDTMIAIGTPMTGFNRQLSAPVWDLGGVFGGIGFNFAFGHNNAAGSTTPFDLTADSAPDTILASGFDPNLAVLFPPSDEANRNIPFRDIPVMAVPDGTRLPVPKSQDAAPWDASKSYPNEDITLGDWMRVRGTMKIKCFDDGTSTISIKARELVPNGLYTLWGVFERDFSGDGNIDGMAPSALGGVPNAIVPDARGKGRIMRHLSFCPMNESTLKIVTLAYHSDGNAYGAMSELGLAGFPGGTTTHDHISWPMNVVEKILPEGQRFLKEPTAEQ